MTAAPPGATARIRSRALDLGFEAVGVATVGPLAARERYEAWLAAGHHGEMRWLANEKHRRRREDPARILHGVCSVVCVALCHEPARDDDRDARLGRIARYAAGEDYHRLMKERLAVLQAEIRAILPGCRALWYADTGAILERGWAEQAGLGWIGKHSGLLSERIGSWFLLGEVLVDRALEPDAPPERERCGTCTRCLDACPTRAFVGPYQLDARRCISYLTIELRGPIPMELRPAIGDWIFGCDVCQEVCPWNRFAPPAREARLHARNLAGWSLERFLTLDEAGFHALFAGSPVRRTGRAGFLRNVCVALGNRGDAAVVPALERTLTTETEPLVRGHAAWALGAVLRRLAAGSPVALHVDAVLAGAADDPEPMVRAEAASARGVPPG